MVAKTSVDFVIFAIVFKILADALGCWASKRSVVGSDTFLIISHKTRSLRSGVPPLSRISSALLISAIKISFEMGSLFLVLKAPYNVSLRFLRSEERRVGKDGMYGCC